MLLHGLPVPGNSSAMDNLPIATSHQAWCRETAAQPPDAADHSTAVSRPPLADIIRSRVNEDSKKGQGGVSGVTSEKEPNGSGCDENKRVFSTANCLICQA
jgi:hypothetical protein